MKKSLVSLLLACTTAAFAGPPESPFTTLANPYRVPLENDNYGRVMAAGRHSFAISWPRVSFMHEPEAEAGAVYLYNVGGNGNVSNSVLLVNPDLLASDGFGSALDMDDTYLVVGAPSAAMNGFSLAGKAYCYRDSQASLSAPYRTFSNPNPEGFEQFGSAVAVSYDNATHRRAAVSALGVNTSAAATGIVHVFDYLTAGAPLLFSIPNPTPGAWEFFGQTLAMSGNLLAVGNPGDQGRKGTVYIYDMNSSTPGAIVHQIESPAAATENEYFGGSMALSGNYLIVGAPEGAGYNGRAYLFDLSSTTPTVPTLVFENPTPGFVGEEFAKSVALVYPHLLIGTPRDLRNGATQYGCAYRYLLSSATPTVPTATYVNLLDPAHGEAFGEAVALKTLDPQNVSAIGVPYSPHVAGSAGAAFFNTAGTDRWFYPSIGAFTTVGTGGFNDFGDRVVMNGNYVVVGAPETDALEKNAGKIYVFDRTSPTPGVPVFSISNPLPEYADQFGEKMSLSGSLLAVACPGRDIAGDIGVGIVYIYDLSSANPATPIQEIVHYIGSPQFGTFGQGMLLQGNVLVASRDTNYQAQLCTVCVFDIASATPATPLLEIPNPGTATRFGEVLARSGSRIAVGSYRQDVGSMTQAGTVYVFDTASATPTLPVHTLQAPAAIAYAQFGYQIVLEGDHLLVASKDVNASNGTTWQGKVYAYDLGSTTPTVPAFLLNDPNPQADGRFGQALAMENGVILVGALGYNLPATSSIQEGAAYRYEWDSSPAGAVRYQYPLPQPDQIGYFGKTMSLAGGWAAIGSNLQSSPLHYNSIHLYGPTNPEIVVEQPLDIPLTSGASMVDYGYVVQTQPKTLQFRIRNTGADHLEISSAGFFNHEASSYGFGGTTFPIIIQPAASVILPVTFQTPVLGSHATDLRLINTDSDEGTFEIGLQAISITEIQNWRHLHFGTIDNSGNAADAADPDGDGFANSLEFLTGSIPLNALSRLQLDIQPDPSNPGRKRVQVSPTRSTTNYRIEYNVDLSPTGWLPLWEGTGTGLPTMHLPDTGSQGAERRFYRAVVW